MVASLDADEYRGDLCNTILLTWTETGWTMIHGAWVIMLRIHARIVGVSDFVCVTTENIAAKNATGHPS
jgi:hypothetical protein